MANFHIFIVLWVLYLISLGLMIADLVLTKLPMEVGYFYMLTNGILLYRLFGVMWFTIILHALIPITVVILLLIFNLFTLDHIIKLSLLLPVSVQLLTAIYLILFRWRRTPEEQTYYSGIHAHIGFVTVVIYFWTMCFLRKRPALNVFLTIFYMLIFLALLLLPIFWGLTQATIKFDADGIHFLTKEERREERTAPGIGRRPIE